MGKRERTRARKLKKQNKRRRKGPSSSTASSQKQQQKKQQHYLPTERTLTVGDGDFSFSAALASHRGTGSGLVATSFDSRKTVLAKYKAAESSIARLKAAGAAVEHSVESDLVQPFEGHTCEAFSDRFIGHICKVSVPPESLARLRAPWQVRLKLGRATGSASVKTE